jgi:ATP-binding cassette subfamily B (MDR/TAP) protein 1
VIDRTSEIDNLSPAGKKPTNCSGHIVFKDVKFSYPTRAEVEVLKGVSFEVPSGKTVALVGKSGSGKSTTVGLLERFYNPKEGSVSLDGVDVRDLNISWLRSKVSALSSLPSSPFPLLPPLPRSHLLLASTSW